MFDKEAFESRLKDLSNKEVYDILLHPDDYREDALEAARKELASRDLEPSTTADLEGEATFKRDGEDLERRLRAEESLSGPQALVSFLFPNIILQFLVAEFYFAQRGYARKRKEFWRWALYGLVVQLLLVALLVACGQLVR
jgi:hypothetical protein